MSRFVYADNAATTPVSPLVLEAMLPWFREGYGNASSIYSKGRESKAALDKARDSIAAIFNAKSNEIFFTSGGSEADNWAIRGAAINQAKRGKKHIITSKFEHHAVLHTVEALAKQGFEISYLEVNSDGLIKLEDVAAALREDTALVTIMYANNEIGTVAPIAEIGALCRSKGVLFHTDAVQATGHIAIDVKAQNIDLLSVSAHKLKGPKGVGLLYVRNGVRIENLIEGGAQERGRRAGTENIAGIVGFAKAIELAYEGLEEKNAKTLALRNRLIDEIGKIERSHLNGDREQRLPGNVNFSFEGIEGESLLLMLDMKGVCASSGSACTSGSLDPSHVLLSIGLSHETAHGSLRLTIDEETTDEDIDYILEILPPIVNRLREMSPLWERIIKGESL
ncbi:MAG: cysteine desulfurase NifS [Oscillospiraceae bacterium]|nr:cysteine desulfurase NifS [Oscillospiraceae bacterium]